MEFIHVGALTFDIKNWKGAVLSTAISVNIGIKGSPFQGRQYCWTSKCWKLGHFAYTLENWVKRRLYCWDIANIVMISCSHVIRDNKSSSGSNVNIYLDIETISKALISNKISLTSTVRWALKVIQVYSRSFKFTQGLRNHSRSLRTLKVIKGNWMLWG